jgi:hypothetical protein
MSEDEEVCSDQGISSSVISNLVVISLRTSCPPGHSNDFCAGWDAGAVASTIGARFFAGSM